MIFLSHGLKKRLHSLYVILEEYFRGTYIDRNIQLFYPEFEHNMLLFEELFCESLTRHTRCRGDSFSLIINPIMFGISLKATQNYLF